ncbi:hypothetical protein [Nostoc sp.]|uniref:hypothetical protein n=1 Tax=Nostoc sp. TaxID=1180 RepID=UPI002FF93477
MMKFAVKSLITLVVTNSFFLLTPMRSDAQVNMNRLVQIAKTCQEDILSSNYYKRMGFDIDDIDYYIKKSSKQQEAITSCIYSRYHYSLVLTKYPWLSSTGEILSGYPGSISVSYLAHLFGDSYHTSILDCIANQDISSEECSFTRYKINDVDLFRRIPTEYWHKSYIVNTCPSCVVVHDDVSGSREEILKAFIKWFFTLDKAQRRELIYLLGDGDEARELRLVIIREANAAVKKYWEVRQGVEEQEQERRRQEVLGN